MNVRNPEAAVYEMSTLQVAKPSSHKLGSTKPVWSADSWFQNLQEGQLTAAALVSIKAL